MSILQILGIVLVALTALGVVTATLLARSHAKWLREQSPVGVWQAKVGGNSVLLQFEGGPHEGLYKEVRERAEGRSCESGHWAVDQNRLRLLIMATDTANHPRFGEDTLYQITYPEPESIRIDGPDRKGETYTRAAEGATLGVDDFAAPPT